MAISFDAKVSIADRTLIRDLKGESVLPSLEQQKYYGLDETGTRMWSVLLESPNIQAAFEQLLEEYDVEEEKLRADLTKLIEKLVEKGLLCVD